MSIGVIGRKVGMTRIFQETGESVPVTVVEVINNRVAQIKKAEGDGYDAIVVAYGDQKASRLNKPDSGFYAKAGVSPARGLAEFRITSSDTFEISQAITANLFSEGQRVDVSGVSKGKGFQGGVKRHNFKTQDSTHGNSLSHRAIGSTGQNQSPGKVFKGKKMPGQMGNVSKTVQNLHVVRVDEENNLLLISGAVPGFIQGIVTVKPAVKKPSEVSA